MQPAVAPPDYSRKWFVMAAVAMGVLLATIDGSIVNVALPTLVDELDTTFPLVQWVALAYLLAMATLTLGVARLGDIVGKKKIYAIGYVVFTVGSVLCGLAPTVGWLIGFRVVQAVGAAMILALGAGILTEAFPASERGKALGVIGTMVSVGIVTGPAVGGLLLQHLSWHWIFFVNLPIGIIGTVTALRFVPNTIPARRQGFDLAGSVLFFGSLLSLMLALTLGQELGFLSPPIAALFASAAVLFAVFVMVELRKPEPMIELRLFTQPLLTVSVVTGFITFVCVSGVFFLGPFYLENVLGLDQQVTGLLLAVSPIALGVVSPVSGWLSDRFGVRPLTIAGLAVIALGFVGLLTLDGGHQRGRLRPRHDPARHRDGALPVAQQQRHHGLGPRRELRRGGRPALADPGARPDHRDRRPRDHMGGEGRRHRRHRSRTSLGIGPGHRAPPGTDPLRRHRRGRSAAGGLGSVAGEVGIAQRRPRTGTTGSLGRRKTEGGRRKPIPGMSHLGSEPFPLPRRLRRPLPPEARELTKRPHCD